MAQLDGAGGRAPKSAYRSIAKGSRRRLSRRQFLVNLGLGGALFSRASRPPYGSANTLVAGAPPGALPAFVQVSASASGITWVHRNARSPEMYLPETTGAGCAFFDYDNDGWMDIYLVNSGKCDFYDPHSPLRNALYHN